MAAEMAKAKAEYVPPAGTKIEQAREIIKRCEALDIKLRDHAIEAENAGDHEGCWFNMATRAHNQRFLERVRADLQSLENAEVARESPNDHEPKHTPTNRPSGRKTNDHPRKLDGLQAREKIDVDGKDRLRTR